MRSPPARTSARWAGSSADARRHDFGDAGPGFPHFLDTLAALPKPVIAAVNGIGVGIGMTMLLHVDIAFIATTARLRAPFVPLGVVPEAAGSLLMPVVMGNQRAALKLYTGDWITADEAVECGLALRAVAPDELMDAAHGPRPPHREDAGRVARARRSEIVVDGRIDAVRAARAREDHDVHGHDRPAREHGGDHGLPGEAGAGFLQALSRK